MRHILLLLLVTVAVAAPQAPVYERTTFEQQTAFTLANDKMELTIGERGGAFMNLALADDPEKLSPFWNPIRMARELGQRTNDSTLGHFLCLDGFGPPSAAERAAGIPFHGEASRQMWQIQSSGKTGAVREITFKVQLPIVQESLTRTVRMVDGENVVYVDSALQSELGIDRPVSWAEHTSYGSPFLESGVTLSSISGSRAQNKPYTGLGGGGTDRRLASGRDFTWPMSVGLDGQSIDLTAPPVGAHFVDHATVLVDTSLERGWIATVNTTKRLVIGYVFKRSEFPWVMNWDNYPANGKYARGLEFSTQPYDESHQDSVARNPMFGAPTFRWLPAKGTIRTSFFFFYAHTPEGFGKVESVRLENGQIVVEDVTKKRITLVASLAQ